MRNIIILRTISVAVTALVCAVWILAGCSSPTTGDWQKKVFQAKTAALTEFAVGFKQEDNLLPDFDHGIKTYTIVLEKEGEMQVSAGADEKMDIIIKIDGLIQPGKSAEFASPVTGGSAVTIEIGAVLKTEGAETAWYSVMLQPPQNDNAADSNLSLLELRYEDAETVQNLLYPVFTQNVTQYGATVQDGDAKGIMIKASAASRNASVEISYDGAVLTHNAPGSTSAWITALPAPGASAMVQIKVTQGNKLGSKKYYVSLTRNMRTVVWTGTVAYAGADGFRIAGMSVQDSSGSVRSQQIAALDFNKDLNFDGTLYPWSLAVDETYRPRYFTVALYLDDGNGKKTSYRSGRLEPNVAGLQDLIEVVAAAGSVGNTISDANELFSKLGGGAQHNYSLANDIDLSEYVDGNGQPVPWDGPSGYNKTFFGNGFTIRGLDLSSLTSGDAGLFKTLDSGAVIQDLTVEATTGAGPLTMTGNSHFGGIIGNPGSSDITIKNVTVKGDLHFIQNTSSYLLCGGLIGEVQCPGANITIINCVSELNITLDPGTAGDAGTFGFGGLVGKAYGSLTIDKSYAAGTMNINYSANRNISAGGLVGEKNGGVLSVTESYAAGNVTIHNTAPVNFLASAGGLVGWFHNDPQVTIKNSAALNGMVIAQVPLGKPYKSRRIIAADDASITAHGGALVNNIARADMIFGGDPLNPAAAQDNPDGVDGKSAAFDDFKLKETWTAVLGWPEAHWDFSGLSQGVWPKIKK